MSSIVEMDVTNAIYLVYVLILAEFRYQSLTSTYIPSMVIRYHIETLCDSIILPMRHIYLHREVYRAICDI